MRTCVVPGDARDLLPEEDVIGDPEDDDDIDDLLPADLWFRGRSSRLYCAALRCRRRRRVSDPDPSPARWC